MPKRRAPEAVASQSPPPTNGDIDADDIARLTASRTVDQIDSGAGRSDSHPGPIDCLWPKIRPRYLVRVWLVETGGLFECVSFRVTSLTPGTAVGSAVMRSLPVGTLIAQAIHRLLDNRLTEAETEITDPLVPQVVYNTSEGPVLGDADEEFLRNRGNYWQSRAETTRKLMGKASGEGKGRRYPPGHLEEVAQIVIEARRHRESASAAVAQVFDITRTAAANQIGRARTECLLDTEERAHNDDQ